MRVVGPVRRTGQMRSAYKFIFWKLEGGHSENLGVDGETIKMGLEDIWWQSG
jgi:hypothetical protein